MINKDLESLSQPIDDFILWKDNPRLGSIEKIEKSIERFGFRSPVFYRIENIDGADRKVIYIGNHRFQAAKNLGMTHIPAIELEADLSIEEIQGLAIADNRTSDDSEYDWQKMSDLTFELDVEILEDFELKDFLPSDEYRSLNDDPIMVDHTAIDFTNECPKCRFRW